MDKTKFNGHWCSNPIVTRHWHKVTDRGTRSEPERKKDQKYLKAIISVIYCIIKTSNLSIISWNIQNPNKWRTTLYNQRSQDALLSRNTTIQILKAMKYGCFPRDRHHPQIKNVLFFSQLYHQNTLRTLALHIGSVEWRIGSCIRFGKFPFLCVIDRLLTIKSILEHFC